ncbi:unnamed protein product [Effrenium voratum]|nr:unnamed protein product [Effrenium voratum]
MCMGPKETVTKAVQQPNLGLCGIQSHCGRDQDHEFKVLRLPRCGHCSAPEYEPNTETELSFPSSDKELLASSLWHKGMSRRPRWSSMKCTESWKNGAMRSSGSMRSLDLSRRSKSSTCGTPTPTRLGYSNSQLNRCTLCRDTLSAGLELTAKHLRFLILLQHLVSEDCCDVTRPERLRKHQDLYDGVLTDSVSSQLIEDAHRCEFSIEGHTFSLQETCHSWRESKKRGSFALLIFRPSWCGR